MLGKGMGQVAADQDHVKWKYNHPTSRLEAQDPSEETLVRVKPQTDYCPVSEPELAS